MTELLLIHSNDTNSITTFTDSSGNGIALTANGNVQHSTAQSVLGQSSSIYFDGSGDYLSGTLPSAIGTGDFTIDFWFRRAGDVGATAQNIFIFGTAGAGTFAVYSDASGGGRDLKFFAAGADRLTSAPLTIGVWVHCAVVRSSGVTKLYINGIDAGGSYTYANNYSVTSFKVGYTASTIFGYLSELRINNTAEWTANFTPPTAPYRTYSVSGPTTDDPGTPCARTVRLYDRATGAFIAETTSDASTGAYDFSGMVSDAEVQRIVLDDSDGTLYNDLIDRVIPG
jgi:hypothetical protein